MSKTPPRWRFYAGLCLIFGNTLVGYGGGAIAGAVYLHTGNILWLKLAGALYAFSWVMVGVGFLLAGPQGVRSAKALWRKLL